METVPNTRKQDCIMSAWVEWDECDARCGVGQQQRHRQVHVLPTRGGEDCPSSIVETKSCMKDPCGNDCAMDEWTPWSACTGSCGQGQQNRTRDILVPAKNGDGCKDATSEIRGCALKPCDYADCQWGEWSEWEKCSCSCDGGEQHRNRLIAVYPFGGGKACDPNTKREIRACNTHKCGKYVDGTWGSWTEWTTCSASCEGGLKFRVRNVESQASDCGSPPEGLSHDVHPCNRHAVCHPDVDCQWGAWQEWHGCSSLCDGVKRRSREIDVQGVGKGAFCEGTSEEVANCNPSLGEPRPASCAEEVKVDCVLSEWGRWSECSVSCGRGQQNRSKLVVPGNGKPCHGKTSEVASCDQGDCPGHDPVNCRWGEWGEWGTCTKCSGEMYRHRPILQQAANGGEPCSPGAAREAKQCPRICNEPTYCTWQEWSQWGACDAKCGAGVKTRRRILSSTSAPLLSSAEKNDQLRMQAAQMDSQNVQQIVVAFVAGAISLVAVLGASRSCRRDVHSNEIPERQAFVA